MADPITLLAIASTAVSAVSSIQQGRQEKAFADANAKIAEENAKRAGQQLAQQDADMERRRDAFRGQQLAAIGSNNVTLSGSALDVTLDSLVENEYERIRARRDAEATRINFANDASMYRAQGKAAQRAGYMNALGTAIGGIPGSAFKGGGGAASALSGPLKIKTGSAFKVKG